MQELKKLILNETVPVSLSAVAVLGLPNCGKSDFLKKIFKKEKETQLVKGEFSPVGLEDSGLFSCTLCVLGGHHYGDIRWSLSSRRLGITYSVLASIIRRWKYQATELKFESETQGDCCFKDESMNSHLKWIFQKVEKLLGKIKNDDSKHKLLGSGFSLVNVFDAGVNKAMYDFLPYLANYSNNLVRIVMFSMERDAGHMHEPPCLDHEKYRERGDDRLVMQWRPRLNYLMHFASLGYQPDQPLTKGDTVFIGSWNEKAPDAKTINANSKTSSLFEACKKEIFDLAAKHRLNWITEENHWIELILNDDSSQKYCSTKLEEIISKKIENKCYLPIKWMCLRGLLSSHENSLIIQDIEHIRSYASLLEMDEKEFKQFLKVFCDYGSILYFQDFPKLQRYVIVDTLKFTHSLDKLYYPRSSSAEVEDCDAHMLHRRYGILTKDYIYDNLYLSDRSLSIKFLMEIMIGLGMLAEIPNGKELVRIHDRKVPMLESKEHYFLPSARVQDCDRQQKHSLSVYLYIQSAQFPANVQANIASALINTNIDMVMIACDISNVMLFESIDGQLTIRIAYFGKETEIRMIRNRPQEENGSMIPALTNVLSACCTAMSKRQQQIRDLDFGIGIKCPKAIRETTSSASQYHFLYYETEFEFSCKECQTKYRDCPEIDLWTKAGKKCSELLKTNIARMKRANPLSLDECACIAEQIAKESEDKIEEIGRELGLEVEELNDLKKEHGSLQDWRAVIEMIFKWEKKTALRKSEKRELPPKQNLAKILKKLNVCKDIVPKLDPEFLSTSD